MELVFGFDEEGEKAKRESANLMMQPQERIFGDITASLTDFDHNDLCEIRNHLPDVPLSDILQTHSLYKLALIYAARGPNVKFMRKVALIGICMKNADSLSIDISNALKENNFDVLEKILKSESANDFLMNGRASLDLITSVLLYGCSPGLLELIIGQITNLNGYLNCPQVVNGFDSHGLTPLISAVLSGNLACLRYLLEEGADINICDSLCSSDQLEKVEDKSGDKKEIEKKPLFQKDPLYPPSKTALMYAVCIGNLECVEILLRYKPNMRKICYAGFTALSYAVITSNYDCLDLLLRGPVQIDKSEWMGSAAQSGHGDSTKSNISLFGDNFDFTISKEKVGTKPLPSVFEKKPVCLKRKKGIVNEVNDAISSQVDLSEEEHSGNSDDDFDPSFRHLDRKVGRKNPLTFDFSGESSSVKHEKSLEKEEILQQKSFSFDVGTGVNLNLNIGDFSPRKLARLSKSKGKTKSHTKREGNASMPGLINHLQKNDDVSNIRDIRSIAEASLPYAIMGNNIQCLKLLLNHCGNLGCMDKYGKTPLMLASEKGKVDFVELLLKNGAGVDFPVSLGLQETALMLAAQNGHKECLSVLLQHNANLEAVNLFKETALMYASKNGSIECMKMLLERKANVHSLNTKGQTPLIIAAENEKAECVKLLLASGSNANESDWCQKSVFMYAVESGNFEIVDLIFKTLQKELCRQPSQNQKDSSDSSSELKPDSPVDMAECGDNESSITKRGRMDEDKFAELYAKKKDRNRSPETISSVAEKALPYSVKGGNMKCFEMLLPYCKKYNFTELMAEKTALMLAAEKGQIECLKLLIEKGVDLDFVPEAKRLVFETGMSAVTCATVARNKECLQLLLDNGADANKGFDPYSKQQNAVTIAVCNKDADCLKLLLEHGANLMSKDSQEVTAFMYSLKCDECLKVIISSGVQVDINNFYKKNGMDYLFENPKKLEFLLKEKVLIMGMEVDETSGELCRNFEYKYRTKTFINGLKLLMKYKVFDWHAWCYDGNISEILFIALLCGIPPKGFFFENEYFTPMEYAMCFMREDIFRYILSNLYFTWKDYRAFTSDREYTEQWHRETDTTEITDWLIPELKSNCLRNSWRLETLCLLTVSDSLSKNDTSPNFTRTDQVDSLLIPEKFKKILKYEGPYSRLCVDHWESIGKPPSGYIPTNILNLTKPSYPPRAILTNCDVSCSCQGIGLKINFDE